MPTWDKILQEVDALNPLAVIDNYIGALTNKTKRTTICYMSAFTIVKPPVPQPFHSIIDQDMQGFMTCSKDINKDALDLIIHTPGGDYEASKRIISYLQSIYKHIRVFIPHMAMSGGTLIACASDEIYMGPYSSLGPTDPQILLNGSYAPINAIIAEFNQAFNEVANDPSKALLWNERLKLIPFGQLQAIQKMKVNAFIYLKELLTKRNCVGKGEDIINEIVRYLNGDHTSHGKGISLKEAQDLKLNVKDLSAEKELEDIILSVYHAATILFSKTQAQKILINDRKARFIMNA